MVIGQLLYHHAKVKPRGFRTWLKSYDELLAAVFKYLNIVFFKKKYIKTAFHSTVTLIFAKNFYTYTAYVANTI